MKYYLLYKDGRRVETKWGGGNTVIVPKHEGDRIFETYFEWHDHSRTPGDDWIEYLEGETKDMTEAHAESRRRIAQWERDAKQRHDAALRTRAARLLQRLAAMVEGSR